MEYHETHSLFSNGGKGFKKRAAFTLAEVPEARQHGSKRAAFTLAEVLITLGIIGVVAAMTIPTLIQKHEEKVTVVKVKKMYSTLSQAYLMNKAKDEIVMNQTEVTNDMSSEVGSTEIAQVFLPYLKISKDCGTTETGCVFSGIYKTLRGVDYRKYDAGDASYSAYRILLQDGSSLWFRRNTAQENLIFYDINGQSQPNTWGKDLFYFQVLNDKILPFGGEETAQSVHFDRSCKTSSDGLGCTAWIIRHGNMDYLHCDGLQLNGPKIKCD